MPNAYLWLHVGTVSNYTDLGLLVPCSLKSPLQGDRDDHFLLELACEPFDARYVYRYTPNIYIYIYIYTYVCICLHYINILICLSIAE